MVPSSFNRVSVDLSALKHNYLHLRQKSSGIDFLAMVKADAYGHGMIRCSRSLEEGGCDKFGVAELREAVLLRQGGIVGQIFSMIGFEPADADAFLEYDIIPVVYDKQSLHNLSKCGVKRDRDVGVHIKVDTGMCRLGVSLDETEEIIEEIKKLPHLYLAGIASHFPSADDRASSSTTDCIAKFVQFQEKAGSNKSVVCHIANSGGTLYFPQSHYGMVRCGISLYGYYPDGRGKEERGDLKPVMSFTTRVLQVKEIEAGTGVSYGSTFIAKRRTRIAVLPVGYEDGFSRHLSNCGEVLIRGRRAPVRGRVCMNLCMVDVTDIGGVEPGDQAVIIGKQGEESITADEIAAKVGTISYEILCMIGNTNEREFV